jgi:predicted O-methyltransferase YrrM
LTFCFDKYLYLIAILNLELQMMNIKRLMLRLKSKRIPKDYQLSGDYERRLRSLVIGEGMLSDHNMKLIHYAIQHLPKEGCVLEIGSYGGLSTNFILHLLEKYQQAHALFTCDAWVYEGFHDHIGNQGLYIDGSDTILRSTYGLYLKTAFIQACQFLHSERLPYSYHTESSMFFEQWQAGQEATDVFGRTQTLGGAIAFAYIDGDHSYAISKNDFEQVAQYIVPGGFILFDDSAHYYQYGSARLMQMVKNDKRFKVLDNSHNWLVQRV